MRVIIRLDDASDFRYVERWDKIEAILDKYGIKPIVGVIPDNKDEGMIKKYLKDESFWYHVEAWSQKGWTIAMHGFNHVFHTRLGGINPVQKRSEFAGVPFDVQCEMIKEGYDLFLEKEINPSVFFPPAHTFDINTIKAIKQVTDIKVICDRIASNVFWEYGIFFLPQQCGGVRKLPVSILTACYHPNNMSDASLDTLEHFIRVHRKYFIDFSNSILVQRKRGVYDRILEFLYFSFRRLRKND